MVSWCLRYFRAPMAETVTPYISLRPPRHTVGYCVDGRNFFTGFEFAGGNSKLTCICLREGWPPNLSQVSYGAI